ncbi:hypothetical protein BIW11_09588 [Tropilaelaps mercedesae]|uniref:Uncharacterized protein n=1 Tax=Tropilaelaps mercedesae TaxID=418985 RepID=A0A1V9XJV1_9ACAR|nr:hypothetical protein BIW11_09588 [Tropilaelaps mercedesae]
MSHASSTASSENVSSIGPEGSPLRRHQGSAENVVPEDEHAMWGDEFGPQRENKEMYDACAKSVQNLDLQEQKNASGTQSTPTSLSARVADEEQPSGSPAFAPRKVEVGPANRVSPAPSDIEAEPAATEGSHAIASLSPVLDDENAQQGFDNSTKLKETSDLYLAQVEKLKSKKESTLVEVQSSTKEQPKQGISAPIRRPHPESPDPAATEGRSSPTATSSAPSSKPSKKGIPRKKPIRLPPKSAEQVPTSSPKKTAAKGQRAKKALSTDEDITVTKKTQKRSGRSKRAVESRSDSPEAKKPSPAKKKKSSKSTVPIANLANEPHLEEQRKISRGWQVTGQKPPEQKAPLKKTVFKPTENDEAFTTAKTSRTLQKEAQEPSRKLFIKPAATGKTQTKGSAKASAKASKGARTCIACNKTLTWNYNAVTCSFCSKERCRACSACPCQEASTLKRSKGQKTSRHVKTARPEKSDASKGGKKKQRTCATCAKVMHGNYRLNKCVTCGKEQCRSCPPCDCEKPSRKQKEK